MFFKSSKNNNEEKKSSNIIEDIYQKYENEDFNSDPEVLDNLSDSNDKLEELNELQQKESILSKIRFSKKKNNVTPSKDCEEPLDETEKILPQENEVFKQKIILFGSLGCFSIVVLAVVLSIFISKSVKTPIDKPLYVPNRVEEIVEEETEEETEEVEESKKEKGSKYYEIISNLAFFTKNSNQSIVETAKQQVEEENKEENKDDNKGDNNTTNKEEENKEEENKEDDKNNTNKTPTSKEVSDLIAYTEKLSIAALKIESCGVKDKVDINEDKYKTLYKALSSKNIKMSDVELFTLDASLYKDYLNTNYKTEHFLVITKPSTLFGDVIYVGEDGQGIKDTDSSNWFAKEIYN